MTAAAWYTNYIGEPAVFAAAIVFIIAYSCLAPWWKQAIGVTLVAMDAVLAGVILPHMLQLAFGINPLSAFFIWFVVIMFSGAVPVIGWRTWILVRVHQGRFRLPWQHHVRPAEGAGVPVAEDEVAS